MILMKMIIMKNNVKLVDKDVEEVFHDNSKKKKRKTNNKKGSSNNNNSTRARYHDGIVTLEEIAELSFFQFTEDENGTLNQTR